MPKKEKKPREYRGVIDEIREQQIKTKDMSAKGKLAYFWDYYKIHTIVVIVVIFFLVTFIRDVTFAKDYCFYCITLNAYRLSDDSLESAFSEYADLDMEHYECFIDASTNLSLTSYTEYDMATVQKLMAVIQLGDLDTAIFNSEIFNNYSKNEMFLDLRTVMSEEELQKYQDYLYYIDYAEVLAEKEMDFEQESSLAENKDEAERQKEIEEETLRHRHPENMTDPIPVGVFLEDSSFAKKSGAYPSLIPVFGIVSSSQRTDTGIKYLEFLWDESIDFSQMLDTDDLY